MRGKNLGAIGAAVAAVTIAAIPIASSIAGAESSAGRASAPSSAKRAYAMTHPAAEAVRYSKALQEFYETQAFLEAVAAYEASQQPQTRGRSGGGGGGGGTCAGSIPGHVIYRESKCDPRAVNGSSGAAGKYQVLASTWAGYGGYATADQAPESVQDQWAAEAYAQAGCRPWGGC